MERPSGQCINEETRQLTRLPPQDIHLSESLRAVTARRLRKLTDNPPTCIVVKSILKANHDEPDGSTSPAKRYMQESAWFPKPLKPVLRRRDQGLHAVITAVYSPIR